MPDTDDTGACRLQCGRGPKPTEIPRPAPPSSWRTCFNVAAGRSPRKCTSTTMPRCGWSGFNVAAGRSPRKCEPDGVEFGVPKRFNVAAGRSPRKSTYAALPPDIKSMLQCGRGPKPTEILATRPTVNVCVTASMWPRAEAHGNVRQLSSARSASICFNVAAGRSPRKYAQDTDPAPPRYASMWPRAEAHGNTHIVSTWSTASTLQCGRGPKPTEIRPRILAENDKSASMWPRAEAHGNPPPSLAITRFSRLLQCGRGPKPTEIVVRRTRTPRSCRFNVAAGRSPRKLGGPPKERVYQGASMWPRAEAHGNRLHLLRVPGADRASMWPRAEAHGNSTPCQRSHNVRTVGTVVALEHNKLEICRILYNCKAHTILLRTIWRRNSKLRPEPWGKQATIGTIV